MANIGRQNAFEDMVYPPDVRRIEVPGYHAAARAGKAPPHRASPHQDLQEMLHTLRAWPRRTPCRARRFHPNLPVPCSAGSSPRSRPVRLAWHGLLPGPERAEWLRGHRTVRVPQLRLSEGSGCIGRGKCIPQPHPLVEIGLRFLARSCDRPREVAEYSRIERHRLTATRRRCGMVIMLRLHGGNREGEHYYQRSEERRFSLIIGKRVRSATFLSFSIHQTRSSNPFGSNSTALIRFRYGQEPPQTKARRRSLSRVLSGRLQPSDHRVRLIYTAH
jgi:hypothetical protein